MSERPSLRERIIAKRADERRAGEALLPIARPTPPPQDSSAALLVPRPVAPRPPRIDVTAQRTKEPQPRRPAATLIGREIHRWMDSHKISQSQLADRLDCTPSYISRLISGGSSPNRGFAMLLADAIEVSHGDMALLMFGIDPFEARDPTINDLYRRYTSALDREVAVRSEIAHLTDLLAMVKLTPRDQRQHLVEDVAAKLNRSPSKGSAGA